MAIEEDRLIHLRHDVVDCHAFQSLQPCHVSSIFVSATRLRVRVTSYWRAHVSDFSPRRHKSQRSRQCCGFRVVDNRPRAISSEDSHRSDAPSVCHATGTMCPPLQRSSCVSRHCAPDGNGSEDDIRIFMLKSDSAARSGPTLPLHCCHHQLTTWTNNPWRIAESLARHLRILQTLA